MRSDLCSPREYYCKGGLFDTGTVEGGEGCFCRDLPPPESPDTTDQKGRSASARERDCPDEEMLLPVNAEEEITVSDELARKFPCQVGIVLDAATACSPLTNLVLDIFEKDNDVDLIFETSNQIVGNGQTSNVVRYNVRNRSCHITTTFQESYLTNSTDLSIARTAIHESIHAVLVYMLMEGNFVSSAQKENDYGNLMNSFVDYMVESGKSTAIQYGNEQHKVMSGLVDDFASALSTYGRENGYSLPYTYYKDLAWGGLTHIKDRNGTPILNPLFMKAVPKSSDRNRILSRLEAEALYKSVNGNNPKGNKCN